MPPIEPINSSAFCRAVHLIPTISANVAAGILLVGYAFNLLAR